MILPAVAGKLGSRTLAQTDEPADYVTQLFAWRGRLGATWYNHLASDVFLKATLFKDVFLM
jgi:hypothetical protein